ncbi:MAG: hypothetical protein D6B25_11770 [Desulfobulbaceae bacterium]|nr:MAG: hypothetical protein D6B25_11770 [Desulfobulbaceae bacterium]
MSTLTINAKTHTSLPRVGDSLRVGQKVLEMVLCGFCLVLFMVLGPFAAPIVLGFLVSPQVLDSELASPECLDEPQ